MSNVCANETLDAMCNVCGIHCATWIGENEHGDREYTLDCLDEDERLVERKRIRPAIHLGRRYYDRDELVRYVAALTAEYADVP